jgi:hypothetical protein
MCYLINKLILLLIMCLSMFKSYLNQSKLRHLRNKVWKLIIYIFYVIKLRILEIKYIIYNKIGKFVTKMMWKSLKLRKFI